jgi:hypothetical protein
LSLQHNSAGFIAKDEILIELQCSMGYGKIPGLKKLCMTESIAWFY